MKSFGILSFFHFLEFLLMSPFFLHAGLVGSVRIIGFVKKEQGIIADMEAGESYEHNENLPHE